MGNVYAVDAEQNLILYTTGKYICLRTSIGENLTRPIVLGSDYATALSDLVFNNTIYYAYQNTNRDIILRNIMEQSNLYKISSRNTPDCFHPQIAAIGNTLLLFYFVRNPMDNSYCLKTLLPLQPEQKFSLPENLFSAEEKSREAIFPSLPALHILPVGDALLVHLSCDAEEFIFTIQTSLQCDRLIPAASLPTDELKNCQEENRKNREVLSLTQTELVNSKNLLAAAQTELTGLQSDLAGRDALIESIRSQYEELMDIATKYREEAVKWHDKFYRR